MAPRALPPWLGTSLTTAQLIGFLMLLRSVAFDRWMTVLVSVLLVVGARAAMRERTWGVLLAFAAASWFVAAFFLGMAPLWFVLFGVLAAKPFLKSWEAMARFDRGAATLAAVMASSLGAIFALGWKVLAPWLFWSIPALRPTMFAGHGLALLALVAGGIAVALRDRRTRPAGAALQDGREEQDGDARVRIGEPVRVVTSPEEATRHDELDDVDELALDADVRPRRRQQP